MNIFTSYLKGVFVLLVVCCYAHVSKAQDSTCVDVISKAEEAYFNIQFEQALSRLEPCIQQESFDQHEEAYLLLARIHYSTQDKNASRHAIHQLLKADNTYSPPSFLPPPFIAFFDETRERYSQHIAFAEKLRPIPHNRPPSIWQRVERHWYWIGGGLVVVSVAAFMDTSDLTPFTFAQPPGPPGTEAPR